MDFVPEHMKLISDFVASSSASFRILSVHVVSGRYVEVSQVLAPEVSEKTWIKYMELQENAITSGTFQVNALSHPIRLFSSCRYLPDNIYEMIYRLAETGSSHNIAMEINGYDLTLSPKLVGELAKACGETSCRVSYGSDAHEPWEFAENMKMAEDLIRKHSLKLI